MEQPRHRAASPQQTNQTNTGLEARPPRPHPWERRCQWGSCAIDTWGEALQGGLRHCSPPRDGGTHAVQHHQELFTVGSCPDLHVACTPPAAAGHPQHPHSAASRPPPAAAGRLTAAGAGAAAQVPSAPAAAAALPRAAAARRQLFGAASWGELEQFFSAQEEQVRAPLPRLPRPVLPGPPLAPHQGAAVGLPHRPDAARSLPAPTPLPAASPPAPLQVRQKKRLARGQDVLHTAA
jgi:hypothetical protein